MAGPIVGLTGAVTSWGSSTTITDYLAKAGMRANQATVYLEGEDIDTTAFADIGVGTAIKGLVGAYAEWEGHLFAPQHGATGLVTFAAGYTTNLNSYTIDVEGSEFQGTAFGASNQAWFPGGFKWGGSFSGFLDDTTALVAPQNASEPATGTFKIDERTTTDATLSGSIFTTRAQAGISPSALNTVSYNFRGSGALTASTPTTGVNVFPTGALAVAAPASLVITASTGRTFTGSAFWTRISLTVGVGQSVRMRVRARCAGTFVIA